MKFNKRGEGTGSSMLYSSFLVVTILVMASSLLLSLVGRYEVSTLPEFDIYEKYYNDSLTISQEFAQTQNYDQNETSIVDLSFEDELFRKGLRSIVKFPETLKATTGVLASSFENTGIIIPFAMKMFLLSLVGILTVTLVVKIVLRYKDV